MKVSIDELWLVPVAMHTFLSLYVVNFNLFLLNMHLKWSSLNFNYIWLACSMTSWPHGYLSYLQLRGPILRSSISKQLIWIQSRLIFKYVTSFFRTLHGQICFVLMYEIFAVISVLPFSRKMMRWRMHILLLHLLVTLM